jgi:hypothetical protein
MKTIATIKQSLDGTRIYIFNMLDDCIYAASIDINGLLSDDKNLETLLRDLKHSIILRPQKLGGTPPMTFTLGTSRISKDNGGWFVEWFTDDDRGSGWGDNAKSARWYAGRGGCRDDCSRRARKRPPELLPLD